MATFNKSHPLNAPGALFTDLSCIDCGTCYHLGPEIFAENSDKSVVKKQPQNPTEWQEAKRAILSCPTNSIGVKNGPREFSELAAGLPLEIAEGVFYLGYTSRDSFGASSYLIKRPDGNILVDSPRFHPWLVKEVENLGGIKFMLLTHQDDVADHKKFHNHFHCKRIIHELDVTNDTKKCEMILTGKESVALAPDLKILMTPGHSAGHVNLLYREKFLFTGDHIFVDQEKHELLASKGVCWFSWSEQIASMKKLLNEDFQWVMPGHGGWGFFGDKAIPNLQKLIETMRKKE